MESVTVARATEGKGRQSMAQYQGRIILNVGLGANTDSKAQERINLLCKAIDLNKLERSEEWITSVDIENVIAKPERRLGGAGLEELKDTD